MGNQPDEQPAPPIENTLLMEEDIAALPKFDAYSHSMDNIDDVMGLEDDDEIQQGLLAHIEALNEENEHEDTLLHNMDNDIQPLMPTMHTKRKSISDLVNAELGMDTDYADEHINNDEHD